MLALFDTHAHLDDDQFPDPAAVIERAASAGVTRIVAVGTTLASSIRCRQLAQTHVGVFASAGIHPNHTHEAQPDDWDRLVALADSPEIVALGETGLDKHWDFAPFDLQQDYFDRHLRLSQRIQKPFIVHMRDCAPEVMSMLRDARTRGPLRGILHSFTGDLAVAREGVELGLHISFAGMVTYKKSAELRAVAREVPAERLLVETDSPYLSPHPHRGQRPNEPALVVHTAACLADERNVSLQELAALTTGNACRLFGVR
jgi:TatD DNase family protein